MFDLAPVPKVITFDCYGTLVQWREVGCCASLAKNPRGGGTRSRGVRWHPFWIRSPNYRTSSRSRSRTVSTGKYWRAGFRGALELTWPAGPGRKGGKDRAVVADDGAASDVPEVLRKLRTRSKLAIFTNSDDDLIAPTVAKIGVPIDYVITAEQARAYKPSRAIFEHAHRTMGVKKEETVHVAMSMILDMQACHELGLRGIWINRRGERGNPAWLPYVELPDLAGGSRPSPSDLPLDASPLKDRHRDAGRMSISIDSLIPWPCQPFAAS